MSDLSARATRGTEVYGPLFDVPPDEAQAAMATRVGPDFAAEAMLAVGSPAFSSDALTARERQVAMITAMVAEGITDDRLTSHLGVARRAGVSDDGLTALMTILAVYLGYERASRAMETVLTGA